MEQLENFPPVKWSMTHPRLAAWGVLSLGMIILLVIEARDVGLEPGNWVALIVATILVAGACIWIVSWEDVDESEPLDPDLTMTATSEMTAVNVTENQADNNETTSSDQGDDTTT